MGVPLALFAGAAAAQKGRLRGRVPRLSGEQTTIQPEGQAGDPPKPDPRVALQQKQEEIRKEVLHLYRLAGELKQETDKTDSSALLSLPLLKKAEQIQKIAKHIQSLARG